MTYCVGMCVDEGLVFLSDTRTNAGVDHVSAARKMAVYEQPGERVIVLLSAGNLALTQAVTHLLAEPTDPDAPTLYSCATMAEAARIVGEAVREVHRRDALSLAEFSVDFNCSFILGGQIHGQPPRLFMVYAAGNFIESTRVSPYFQIGESKYGKPIIDRVLVPSTPLDEAAKCALISMDSTLRSNLSVGLPLDLLVYQTDALKVTRFVSIDQDNTYYQMIHRTWGERLRQVFSEIPEPDWRSAGEVPENGHVGEMVLYRAPGAGHEEGAGRRVMDAGARPAQTLAEGDMPKGRR
jgi:putative proteasome-type protease